MPTGLSAVTMVQGARWSCLQLVKKAKKINMPLFITFMSALVVFLRALSGAGYEGDLTPGSISLTTLPENVSLNSSSLTNSRDGWQSWVHFLEGIAGTLWTCPSPVNQENQSQIDQETPSTESDSSRNEASIPPSPRDPLFPSPDTRCYSLFGNLKRSKLISKESNVFETPDMGSIAYTIMARSRS